MSSGVLVRSVYGTPLVIPEAISYWACKLQSDRWCTERDIVPDPSHPLGERPFDWTLDLVGTGDIGRIKELWILCPPTRMSPTGSTGRLLIKERGSPFQFKIKSTSGLVPLLYAQRETQVIGRIDDKLSGRCTCFIYDHTWQALSMPYVTNIYDFAPWREGLPAIRGLSASVLGFDLS